jgi:hypothetical protein
MKKVFLLGLIMSLFIGCGNKEENLAINNAQAFAYDLGPGGWELNATAVIKNIKNNRNENEFTASLSVNIELINPDGETSKNIYNEVIEKKGGELINEMAVETQYEIDSTYSPGTYSVKFIVKDNVSGETAESSSSFEVIEEDE